MFLDCGKMILDEQEILCGRWLFGDDKPEMKTDLPVRKWIVKNCSRWAIVVGLGSVILLCSTTFAEEPKDAGMPPTDVQVYKTVGLGFAAALSISLSVIGASYAVGRIGSAALGAAAEKPELLTRSILFVALAEGLAVLGFAIAMMILQKI
jgi:V/A-type H+/Na+-transporting ATPase subunit K